MPEPTDIQSVMLVDDKSNKIYGLSINREAARWNYNKVSFSYFQCDFDEFVKIFGSPRNRNSRINALNNSFPMALRAILKDGSYIFERPPFQYTVHLSPKNARHTSMTMNNQYISETVWIPWSFYQLKPAKNFTLDQIPYSFSLFFSDQKITSFDHSFTVAPLPNVFADGKVCLGDSGANLYRDYLDLSDKDSVKDIFNIFINTFYSGGWNADVLGHILPMFDYVNFNYPSTHPDYDRLKDIYYKARKSVVPISHRDPSVRNYINALKMWSNMSLEDTLVCFNAHIHSDKNYTNYHSLDTLAPENELTYFNSFLANNKLNILSPSFKSQQYFENPTDRSVVYLDNDLTESDYYSILNNLIDYFKDIMNDETPTYQYSISTMD